MRPSSGFNQLDHSRSVLDTLSDEQKRPLSLSETALAPGRFPRDGRILKSEARAWIKHPPTQRMG
jgi:hypothetical protein